MRDPDSPNEPDDAACGDDTLRESLFVGDDSEPEYEEIDVSP